MWSFQPSGNGRRRTRLLDFAIRWLRYYLYNNRFVLLFTVSLLPAFCIGHYRHGPTISIGKSTGKIFLRLGQARCYTVGSASRQVRTLTCARGDTRRARAIWAKARTCLKPDLICLKSDAEAISPLQVRDSEKVKLCEQ